MITKKQGGTGAMAQAAATDPRALQGARSARTRVPAVAAWLGAFGALPFVCLAMAGVFLKEPWQSEASSALVAYGAVILSFLGGIHWGLAIAEGTSEYLGGAVNRRLVVSVVPSLVAWCAFFLPSTAALAVLAAAFAMMLIHDLHAAREGEAPAWYPALRWPLTTAVVASLALSAVA